jgi:hypothetical protein
MGEGIGSGSFSNYPRGYWGATVVACDPETEEWVLRFDETYGNMWDADWQFEDPPESELEFQRTGREMVFGSIAQGMGSTSSSTMTRNGFGPLCYVQKQKPAKNLVLRKNHLICPTKITSIKSCA